MEPIVASDLSPPLPSPRSPLTDIPPLVFIATEVALIPYELNTNDRLGSEQWDVRALAIAVDIRENMTYWISAEDNVSCVLFRDSLGWLVEFSVKLLQFRPDVQ